MKGFTVKKPRGFRPVAVVMMSLSAASAAADETSREAVATAPTAGQVANWIAELDCNQYQVRERASQQLLAAGKVTLDPLLIAANGDRPEPADRAIWVLQQLGASDDYELARAALEKLIRVEDRPEVVEQSIEARSRLGITLCRRKLGPLGAQLTVSQQASPFSDQPVEMVWLKLDRQWQGTEEDLGVLRKLEEYEHFRLDGAAVGDKTAKMFEQMDRLRELRLENTSVTPAAVDALKERHPDAVIYMRNRALMGIAGSTHEQGVRITDVRPDTGAANAGLHRDDIITQIDGRMMPDFDRLTARIAQHEPGDHVEVTIVRGEETLNTRITLGRWPDAPRLGAARPAPANRPARARQQIGRAPAPR